MDSVTTARRLINEDESVDTSRETSTLDTASVGSTTTLSQQSHDSIPDIVKLEDWQKGTDWRYVLPQLIHNADRKESKSDDMTDCSDAVVWNVVRMNNKLPFPSTSPPPHLMRKAKVYLRLLKTELNKVFYDEAQLMYWKQANQSQWHGLRGDGSEFVNFRDLVKRTKACKGELVSALNGTQVE